MAHDVFISHSAQNREVADTICATLEKGGIRCWVAPRDVRPGRAFPGEITRAIQRSKVMLLIFSRHSNNSEQVLREVQLATDSRLPLVRFRIEDVSMNDDLKYFLSTPHWLDALTPPLSGHVARLEVAIRELLSQSVEVSGKNVEGEPPQPDKSPAASFAVLPAASAAPPPPPVPKATIGSKESVTAGPSPAARPTTARKSATPWIILAIAAVAVFGGIICIVFLILLQSPQEQASTAQSQETVSAETSPGPAASPSRVAKAKQKPVSQPAEPLKTTKTTAKTENSSETESGSAFERAGSLKGRDEPMAEPESEPANAFDRAGRDIGSDDSEAEPSPEEE